MPDITRAVEERSEQLLVAHQTEILRRTDRMFAWLMLGQWAFAILLALVISPYAWEGRIRSVHIHVYAALLLGGLLCSLPVSLAFLRPGWAVTRHVIAAAQMLWSALLIHLTGGRIESHVFGSLAFLSFYRDFRPLITATLVVASDHFLRGLYWPDSVYGVASVQWWRFLEHAFWVLFEDLFLIMACIRGVAEMRAIQVRQAQVEALSASERQKATELERALVQLKESQAEVIAAEKRTVIQFAASVAHELRNPLAAIRNALVYIDKKIHQAAPAAGADPRVRQFSVLIERELSACGKIISDLLDFARERQPVRAPCPLRALAAEAISLVPPRANVQVRNEVPDELPVPCIDRDQFRQVLVNLVQNGVEALPEGRGGTVVIQAGGGADRPFEISVADDGTGIPPHLLERVFQPLFTTKIKGTGLGLAIVANMVARHHGTLQVESEPGRGTRITIHLPADASARAAA
jgi:signal transduction histidine kinase